MRKRNRWTRLLAMILAVAMVLSSQSVTAFATQFGAVVNNGTNETETPDETQTTDETDSEANSLPSPDQSAEETVNKPGVISGEGVNIRKGPGTDYEVVTKLQSGDAVTVLTQTTVTNGDGAEEVWYRIQYGTEGAEAYVLSEFVAVSETVEESEPESAEEPQVTAYSNSLEAKEGSEQLSVADLAEAYYGANATQPKKVANVTISEDFAGTDVKAGGMVTYTISYTLNAAETYGYTNQPLSLYDTYDNTVIRWKLPAGLSIDTTQSFDGVTASYDESTGEYVFTLKNTSLNAQSSTNATFRVPVKIDGNGSLEIGHQFDLDAINKYLTISTEFTVKDKTDEENIEKVKEYAQTNVSSSTLNTLKSVTDDNWKVEKSFTGATPSEDKSEVTVSFLIKVGLSKADGNLALTTDSAIYERDGRVPLATEDGTISLTDTLSKLLDREEQEIKPESITVTENFGSNAHYDVTSGEAVSVKMNTCKAAGLDTGKVDGGAPYYSEYKVDVVYPYAKFIAQYYDTNQDLLTVENTAEIEYTLKGGSENTDSSTDSGQVGEVTEPAQLTIKKYILGYDEKGEGSLYAYKDGGWTPVTGAAEFTITKADGTPAILYTRTENGDGTYTYTKLSENGTVSIDPTAEGADGTVTVFLDEGNYTIKETGVPENTEAVTETQTRELKANDPTTVSFTNKELLGTIRIEKKGTINGVTSGLNGASFGVYSDAACETEPITGSTGTVNNAAGILEFDRLVPGTYYVKEITAPEGYLKDDTVWTVTIGKDRENTVTVSVSGNADEEVTDKIQSTNISNTAYLQLQKQYYWFGSSTSENNWQNVGSSNYGQFNGAFTLLRSTEPDADKSSWEIVKSGQNLTNKGTYLSEALAVYDEDDNLYYYCFKETLPDEWHAAGEAEAADGSRYVYSEPVTLEDAIGKSSADPVQITMRNTQNGTLTLTKSYVTINDQGQKVTATAGAGAASFNLYQEVNGTFTKVNVTSYTTDAFGKVVAEDLPVQDTNNQTINYYWVETDSAGYVQESTKKTTITVDGESLTAVGPFNFLTKTAESGANLEQSAVVTNVEQKVPVKIQKIDSHTESYLPDACITIYKGSVDEKNIVSEYNNVAIPEGGLTAILETGYTYIIVETTVPDHHKKGQDITVDLTKYTVTSTSKDLIEETLENDPEPSVVLTKLRKDESGTETLNAQFEVYKEDLTPVLDEDGEPVILTAGTALYLDPGTYYLHEIVTDEMKVLDPDDYEESYTTYNHKYKDGTFYFGPYTVEDKPAPQDLGTITNISSLGSVQVKKTDEDGNALKDADLEIYYIDASGKKIVVGGAQKTPANGLVTFEDLPVYDEEHKEITYFIRETNAPEGYYSDGTELFTTLVPGETVTKVNGEENGAALTLVNKKETTFTVKKVYYDVWEHSFTGTELSLEGAQIALYKKQDDGTYAFVEMKKTDILGQVTFEGLTNETDDKYVAIEFSIPNREELELVEPENNKKLLSEDHSKPPMTLTDISAYNVVTREGTEPQTMTNVINWTQIRVEKFKMVYEDGVDPKNPGDKEETVEVPQNFATFQLWKQVLPEDTPSDEELSFDEGNCTLVGTYNSGTFAEQDGDPVDGKFATDILDVADNIVYWLVETDAGIGAEIIPEENYVLFMRANREYKNNTNNGESTKTATYPDNNYTKDYRMENEALYGDGPLHVANIRLSKWAGSAEGTFTPLGGAKYELYVANESGKLVEKIQDMTAGLESDPNKGQNSSFIVSDALYYENDHFERFEKLEEEGNDDDIIWQEGEYIYIRMAIRETYAPQGYQMDDRTYYLIARFVPSDGTDASAVNNDMYFVVNADANVSLAENQPTDPIVWAKNGEQYRLVNWPEENFSVTVNKYGYLPEEEVTTGLTAEDLDAVSGSLKNRTALSGVSMRLQRLDADGTWKNYNYKTQDWDKIENGTESIFTTDGNGRFNFPDGLEAGSYRIIEVSVPQGYEALYDGSTIGGTAAARYFEVTNQSVTVNMYNPESISIEVGKADLDENPVSGLTFNLTRKGESAPVQTVQTVADGTARFSRVATGTYYLTESSTEYSTRYLAAYLKAAYPNLADFADKNKGIFLGYTRGAKDGDIVVSAVTDLTDYDAPEGGKITVTNPPFVNLTIQKTDEKGEALPGATFSVYYRPFASAAGEQTINPSYTGAEKIVDKQETDSLGQIKLTGKDPGIYYIVEDSAPAGYDKAEDPDQILVLTGGMKVRVASSGDYTVEDGTETGEDAVEVAFSNTSQAGLTISKTVEWGSMEAKDYSFTFNLYDTQNAKEPLETVTLTNSVLNKIFSTKLSREKTYYLEEAAVTGYAPKSLTVNGQTVTPVNGRYAFTVPKEGNIEVEAVNTYLYAKVTILKADGNTGEGLTGASFQLQYEDGTPVPEGMVTWSSNDRGEYTAVVRLDPKKQDSETGAVSYQIKETLAPDTYLASDDPIKLTLTPGKVKTYTPWSSEMLKGEDPDTEMLKALIMPNYNGVTFVITKYNNMQGSSAAVQSGVTFRLYVWEKGEGEDPAIVHQTSVKTDQNGVAAFTVPSGYKYAVAEEQVPAGYIRLQGVWSVSQDGTETEITNTEERDDLTLYVLGDSENFLPGQIYQFNAYNIPQLKLEVHKEDALNGTAPTASVSVYEVPDGTKTELTQEEVKALEIEEKRIAQATTQKVQGETGFTSTEEIDIEPGKTYLIVEDQVTSQNGTIILDDNRVVWYKVLEVPEGTTQKQIVTLENIQGAATLGLTKKSGVTAEQPSLFNQSVDLTYTLDAQVTNTYGADSFVIEDQGLTAYHEGQEDPLNFDTYLKNQYTITGVVLNQASHDVTMYDNAKDDPAARTISAKVTFLNFEGTSVYEETVTVSDGSKTIDVPETEKDKVARVTVEYFSTGLKDATGYALGQRFDPGVVTVAVTMDQQAGGDKRLSIDRVENTAQATLTYRKWSSVGAQESADPLTATATAENTFGEQQAASASVSKTADKDRVEVGESITYTLTMTNSSTNGSVIQKPVFVDLLPKGVTVDTSSEYVELPQGYTASSIRTVNAGENTAVVIELKEDLAAGESVAVNLTVMIGSSVISQNMTKIKNLLFVTSGVKGVVNDDNPLGSAFKDAEGWAKDLESVAGENGVTAEQIAQLKEGLGEIGNYGYISAVNEIDWTSGSTVTLLKENYGDLDAEDHMSYSSTRLARADNGGHVYYRLTVRNPETSNQNYTKLAVMDVLPADGDISLSGSDRGSAWPVQLASIDSVTVGGKSVAYTVYYYRGEVTASTYQDIRKIQTGEALPAGWSTDGSNLADVTAFIIAVDKNVSMEAGQNLTVTYTTDVENYDTAELAEISYENAVNNFIFHYSSYRPQIEETAEDAAAAEDILVSNSVSATIVPVQVQVGGQVWIDANANGKQDDISEAGTSIGISDYTSYAIVQDLLQKIQISLTTHTDRTTGRGTPGTSTTFRKGENWKGAYVFKGLDAGLLTMDVEKSYDAAGNLITKYLKGTNPATYTMTATLTNVVGDFVLTKMLGSGRSQEPGKIPESEQKDNNFDTATGSIMSERFYLWPTNVVESDESTWDNTKDIGFVLYRDLELTKTAADDTDTTLKSAEFEIYGPFEKGEVTANNAASKLTADKKVGETYTTDDEGKIKVADLFWFKEYVIKETKTVDGYELEDATVLSGANVSEVADHTWLLAVPDEKSMVTTDTVTIGNIRETEVELEATKKLSGKNLTDNTFTFQLLAEDGKTVLDTKTTAKVDADTAAVTFAAQTVQGVGTHTFYIKEVVPQENPSEGVTYDETTWRAVVKTVWNEAEKELKVDSIQYYKGSDTEASQDGAVFNNEYEATGPWTPEGTKTLTGRDMKQGETFTFSVREVKKDGAYDPKDPATYTEVSTGSVTGGKNGEPAAITFSEVTYGISDVGSHTYAIVETGTAGAGVTLDETVFTVNVQVSDKKDGTLKVEPQYPVGGVAFENKYEVKPTTTQLSVSKAFSADSDVRPAANKKDFTFELAFAKDGNPNNGAELPETTEIQITDAGSETFDAITFNKAGTYTFKIKETKGSEGGYTYDESVWTATVTVVDQESQLTVTEIQYAKNGTVQSGVSAAAFENKYKVTPTKYEPKVEKTIDGDVPEGEDQTFTFTLSHKGDVAQEGADLPAVTEIEIDGEGSKSFEKITFTKAGTYEFTIKETQETIAGYTFDGTTWNLRVVVEDHEGKLVVASHTYTATGKTGSTEQAAFENHYKPSEIGFTPRVKKELSGDPVTTDKTFTFTLSQATEQAGVTLGETTATVTGADEASFGQITFEKAGDYTFTIAETKGTDAGYTYDEEPWTLIVKVRDTEGVLGVSEWSYSRGEDSNTEAALFTNTYKLTEDTYAPMVAKRLSGDPTPSDQTYTFKLEADGANPEGAALGESTAAVTGTGTASFGAITFTRPGIFKFTITEDTNVQPAGYTYDTSQWTLTVVVEDQDSKLTVISHVYRLDQDTSSNDQATFTNHYEVTDTSYTPNVRKEITGADTPADKIFTFILAETAGNPAGYVLPTERNTTVTGENTGSFQPIQFTAAGEYNFTITEKAESENGYTYDASAWNLYVKVEDEDSHLKVTETIYTKTGTDPAVTNKGEAVFTNTYQITEGISFTPKVTKAFTGEKRPEEKTFLFQLKADEKNPQGGALPVEAQTSVTGAGTASFGAISFTKAGTYRFYITEKDSKEDGYTYDTSPWTLTVEVRDNDSKLEVDSYTYSKGTGTESVTETEAAVFTNNYKVEPTEYAPQVSKKLTGESRPSEKEFTFSLTADEENPEGAQLGTASAKVTGEGTASFGEITFTKAGTYSFEIRETDSKTPGYTYDTSPWTLTVKVEDKDSKLEVTSHTYTKAGDDETKNESAAVFTNDYQVEPTEYAPKVKKTVTGDTPQDETFTFRLAADEENLEGADLPQNTEITVTGSGEKEFDPITFTKAGTYRFEISESSDGVPGYTYDGSIWTLTVTVTDVDSNLTVTDENVTYEKTVAGVEEESHEAAAFTNRYDTTAVGYTPWVSKELTGETTPVAKTFNFTLEVAEGKDYGEDIAFVDGGKEASVEGAGRANFGEITFNKRGTYEFTIKEAEGSDAGYTYDGSEWTLTVVVQDVNSILTVASHTYTKTGDTAAENEDYAEFSNDYQVTSTEYIPAVEKTVTGTPANDQTFTFGIAADSENPEGAALPADTEITVEGSGSAQFDAIDFTKAGTYSFVITETAGGETWYEYDGSEWTLTVTVEDHESVLEVTDVVYAKDGAVQEEAQAASFTNSYHASGTLTLDNFSKALTGSPLAEGQFTFTLTDADGNVLQTVTNGADGSIAFEPLTYDETDIGQTYTYTVSETNGNATGITYDETVYTVNVTVADSANSDGTLAVTTEILNGDQAVEGEGDALPEIAFENTFSGSVTLTKQGEDGRLLAGAEFTLYARGEGDAYEVYAAEGNAQGIYTTGANGQLQVTNLPANDYYFVETQAPAGYVIQTDAQGEPLHYEFRIGVMDGAAGIVENAQVNAALTVTNPGATNGSIQVTKRVSQIDDNFDIVDLVAQDMTFYVGLFTDAAGTQPYGTDYIRQITMDGVTVSEPVTFTGLPSGTYYVLETTADGTPIAMNQQQQGADGSSFYCTVEGGGSNAGVIDLTVSSEPGTIALQNVYAELPEEGYYWEGSLEITKRVLRDGQAVTADDTFYAGVYQLNEAGAYELVTEVELRQNDTVTVTGLSGPVGGSMTYYVFETDGNGNMISDDPNFMYSVSGEGSVTITETDTTGRVTITNEAVEETTTVETEGSSTTTSTTSSSSGTTSGKSVKTGDTTNIMPALISLIVAGLAVIALGCGIYRRRRRNGK